MTSGASNIRRSDRLHTADPETHALRRQIAAENSVTGSDTVMADTPAPSGDRRDGNKEDDPSTSGTTTAADTLAWALQQKALLLSSPPSGQLEALKEFAEKLTQFDKIIASLTPKNRHDAREEHAARTRQDQIALDNLAKKEATPIGTLTQKNYDLWVQSIENRFEYTGATVDCDRRTRWAIEGFKRETSLYAEIHRRLVALDGDDLLWSELKRIVQDFIRDPAVRRFDTALEWYTSFQRDNQKFDQFLAHMQRIEPLLGNPPHAGEEQKIDFWFTRLHESNRLELLKRNFAERVHRLEDLFSEIRLIENIKDLTKSRDSKSRASPPRSHSKRRRSAEGSENRQKNKSGGQQSILPDRSNTGSQNNGGTPNSGASQGQRSSNAGGYQGKGKASAGNTQKNEWRQRGKGQQQGNEGPATGNSKP